MKKLLLLSCAFAACVGASAQKFVQASVPTAPQKLSQLSAAQFKGVVAKPHAQKVTASNFVGIFINNAWDDSKISSTSEETKDINTSTTDTMFTANVTDDQGNKFNIKWDIYQNALGHVYGQLDEATNAFTVPVQLLNDGTPVQITEKETSPIAFYGVSTNDYLCNFEAQYDPTSGQIVLNDTIAGYITLVAEGSQKGYYVFRNLSPTIARANAVHTGFYNTDAGWEEFEQPVWLDLSAAEDGVIDVYNHFITAGASGCKLSIDVDGENASMATGQPMVYISNTDNHATYGKYILLRAVDITDDGYIRPNFDASTIEGGTYKDGVIAFGDANDKSKQIYYRGFSNTGSDGSGYATPFYVNSRFEPLNSTGIAGVTVKANKTADNRIFNLAGQQVGKDYKGVVIQNGVKKLQK